MDYLIYFCVELLYQILIKPCYIPTDGRTRRNVSRRPSRMKNNNSCLFTNSCSMVLTQSFKRLVRLTSSVIRHSYVISDSYSLIQISVATPMQLFYGLNNIGLINMYYHRVKKTLLSSLLCGIIHRRAGFLSAVRGLVRKTTLRFSLIQVYKFNLKNQL